MTKYALLILALAQNVFAEMDLWDLPPISYSASTPNNAVSKMSADLSNGSRKIEGTAGLDRLRFVLQELRVPESSQILVFSKTSAQNALIHPLNPRSLFFSEEAYVGFVPGGFIEVIVQDPLLGPVFYNVTTGSTNNIKFDRDTTNCMSCHGDSSTERTPGMKIRSVFPDSEGLPMLGMGTSLVNHETPLADRWGGYYVTGRSSLPHLGNRTYIKDGPVEPQPSDLNDLTKKINVSEYPRPTSDIVALLVIEHQCQMHNLLNAATTHYRRTHFLSKSFDSTADPDTSSAGRVADAMAEKIVDCLFFKGEADLGEDIQGGDEFQKVFEDRYPRTKEGHSLADFRLYGHLFKHRCSYMVYSSAFKNLPARVKNSVFQKMRAVLAGENPAFDHIKAAERKKIADILAETLPGWNE
jgi:hypothetical protein